MGVILAKFRKEKSTQAILEALQEKIDELETFTVNTQQQKKRIVGNFLAVSIGVYVIAFVVFYFVYFPKTWQQRLIYFLPLLLFPIIIIQLRYLFAWYFQRKLNKNSKKLSALRAEKKKILEQVMDKETYKVAKNLLDRFADKPSKITFALTSSTPSKPNQPVLNRSIGATNFNQRSQQLALPATPSPLPSSNYLSTNSLRLNSQSLSPSPATALMAANRVGINQQLRRRTPFPIVNQQEKGVFDRIVDVLIGDGPQDRFAMICKECYSHNGMALKEDFEYTTFKCAFCNALNPARKARPVAPRLSIMPAPAAPTVGSDTSDSDDDKDDYVDEALMNLSENTAKFSLSADTNHQFVNSDTTGTSRLSPSSDTEEDKRPDEKKPTQQSDEIDEENMEVIDIKGISVTEFLKAYQKSDSAIEDTSMSPE